MSTFLSLLLCLFFPFIHCGMIQSSAFVAETHLNGGVLYERWLYAIRQRFVTPPEATIVYFDTHVTEWFHLPIPLTSFNSANVFYIYFLENAKHLCKFDAVPFVPMNPGEIELYSFVQFSPSTHEWLKIDALQVDTGNSFSIIAVELGDLIVTVGYNAPSSVGKAFLHNAVTMVNTIVDVLPPGGGPLLRFAFSPFPYFQLETSEAMRLMIAGPRGNASTYSAVVINQDASSSSLVLPPELSMASDGVFSECQMPRHMAFQSEAASPKVSVIFDPLNNATTSHVHAGNFKSWRCLTTAIVAQSADNAKLDVFSTYTGQWHAIDLATPAAVNCITMREPPALLCDHDSGNTVEVVRLDTLQYVRFVNADPACEVPRAYMRLADPFVFTCLTADPLDANAPHTVFDVASMSTRQMPSTILFPGPPVPIYVADVRKLYAGRSSVSPLVSDKVIFTGGADSIGNNSAVRGPYVNAWKPSTGSFQKAMIASQAEFDDLPYVSIETKFLQSGAYIASRMTMVCDVEGFQPNGYMAIFDANSLNRVLFRQKGCNRQLGVAGKRVFFVTEPDTKLVVFHEDQPTLVEHEFLLNVNATIASMNAVEALEVNGKFYIVHYGGDKGESIDLFIVDSPSIGLTPTMQPTTQALTTTAAPTYTPLTTTNGAFTPSTSMGGADSSSSTTLSTSSADGSTPATTVTGSSASSVTSPATTEPTTTTLSLNSNSQSETNVDNGTNGSATLASSATTGADAGTGSAPSSSAEADKSTDAIADSSSTTPDDANSSEMTILFIIIGVIILCLIILAVIVALLVLKKRGAKSTGRRAPQNMSASPAVRMSVRRGSLGHSSERRSERRRSRGMARRSVRAASSEFNVNPYTPMMMGPMMPAQQTPTPTTQTPTLSSTPTTDAFRAAPMMMPSVASSAYSELRVANNVGDVTTSSNAPLQFSGAHSRFYRAIGRAEAESILAQHAPGVGLVRLGSAPNTYVLSYSMSGGAVGHTRIDLEPMSMVITSVNASDETQRYANAEQLFASFGLQSIS